jgi:hypothetical protein
MRQDGDDILSLPLQILVLESTLPAEYVRLYVAMRTE